MHPSLQPLLRANVPLEFLESLADELFSLHDGSPPMLLQGGPCRKMTLATLATLVMYYPERFKANEAMTVLAQMRDAYAKLASVKDEPHTIFVKWGAAIRKQFDVDNLHLTARHGHGELEQIVGAINSLSSVLNSVQASVSDVAARVISIESRLDRMDRRLESNAAAVSPLPLPTPTRAPTSAPELPAAKNDELPAASSDPISHAAPSAFDQLTGVGGLSEYKTARVLGGQFYIDCMSNGGNLVAVCERRRAACQRVFDAYQAMTSEAERCVLLETPRDLNHCNGIVR